MKLLCNCPECKKVQDAYWRFNYNKNGTVHIRCECKICGRFIKWVTQDEETLSLVTKNKELF